MNALPLSWQYLPGLPEPVFRTVRLPFTRRCWVYAADVPPRLTLAELWPLLVQQHPKGVFIRGVPPPQQAVLAGLGATCLTAGREALIHLAQYQAGPKRSLRELARRGARHGQVREFEPTLPETQHHFQELLANSRIGHRPKLRYLFRLEAEPNLRVFALAKPDGTWLGALTLSCCQLRHSHTEELLRHQLAPVGVMEALIHQVCAQLAAEGALTFSLGEVPFVGYPAHGWARVYQWVGLRLRKAYDSQALAAFKQKFQPEWRPLVVVSNKPIGLFTLLDLFLVSGAWRLALRQLFRRNRAPGPRAVGSRRIRVSR